MKALGYIVAIYLVLFAVHVATCFAIGLFYGLRERMRLERNARRARKIHRMIETLRREHREAELIPAGEMEYLEYGED